MTCLRVCNSRDAALRGVIPPQLPRVHLPCQSLFRKMKPYKSIFAKDLFQDQVILVTGQCGLELPIPTPAKIDGEFYPEIDYIC